jgi:uncharacterized membrane protein
MVKALLRGRLADLLEFAGAVCLIVAAAFVATALAWTVAGVALIAKAAEIETRSRPRPTERERR